VEFTTSPRSWWENTTGPTSRAFGEENKHLLLSSSVFGQGHFVRHAQIPCALGKSRIVHTIMGFLQNESWMFFPPQTGTITSGAYLCPRKSKRRF